MRLLYIGAAGVVLVPLLCWFLVTLITELLDHRRSMAQIGVELEKVKRGPRNNSRSSNNPRS